MKIKIILGCSLVCAQMYAMDNNGEFRDGDAWEAAEWETSLSYQRTIEQISAVAKKEGKTEAQVQEEINNQPIRRMRDKPVSRGFANLVARNEYNDYLESLKKDTK